VVADCGGFPAVHHGGGMPGVKTHLVLFPTAGAAVALVANTDGCDFRPVLEALLPRLLPTAGDRSPAAEAGAPAPGAPGGPARPAPAALRGEWRGHIHTAAGAVPLDHRFGGADSARARLGAGPETDLTEARFDGARLPGGLPGPPGTADTDRRPHHLEADLYLRGGVLQGALAAASDSSAAGLGGHGLALSHWTTLERAA
jgi:hypothetical protein